MRQSLQQNKLAREKTGRKDKTNKKQRTENRGTLFLQNNEQTEPARIAL